MHDSELVASFDFLAERGIVAQRKHFSTQVLDARPSLPRIRRKLLMQVGKIYEKNYMTNIGHCNALTLIKTH